MMWGVELQDVVLVSAVKLRVEPSHVRNDNNIDGCEISFKIVNKTRVLLQLQCLAGRQLSRGHTTIERTQQVFTPLQEQRIGRMLFLTISSFQLSLCLSAFPPTSAKSIASTEGSESMVGRNALMITGNDEDFMMPNVNMRNAFNLVSGNPSCVSLFPELLP